MPTISVNKADLFKALGRKYSTEEFDELCFEFGIELDEDTTDQTRPIVDGVEEPPQLKIEIPANRYDMLCFEGISMNLNVFLGRYKLPRWTLKAPPDGMLMVCNVKPETNQIRPYFSAAILRNIKFTPERYESFISLQDKLHQNLARQRTLVAIGTHDLDTIEGPISYEALPPEQIKFAPLNQSQEMTGSQMMEFYEKDRHISRYLPIIRDSPVYPIIYDARRTVLSMPPIINSNRTKITLNTRNVFIDITATDKTKIEIVNCILVAMFSEYCSEKFSVEPVKIVSPHNNETRQVPDLTPRHTQAEVSYINSCCGVKQSADEICHGLEKMGYVAMPSNDSADLLNIEVPPTRADVLHQCDIMEDAAIAYGFNKLPRTFPSKSISIGAPLPINKVADIVRIEAAVAGWSEVLPLILCSHDENFGWMNRKDDGTTAVRLQNPKTAEYQVVRTSLLPGLLKCIRENKQHSIPIKIFESSDVAFKDPSRERKSRNERHFAAAFCGATSGFEMVHGLLDRIMLMLKCEFMIGRKSKRLEDDKIDGAILKELDGPIEGSLYGKETFFAGHAASVHVRIGKQWHTIGVLGTLHPTVLEKFELALPVSVVEINLEPFL